MIKAIIFDVGGVLQIGKYSWLAFRRHRSTSVHKFMARKFHITLDQWFDSIDTAYAQAIEGKISKKQALSIMAKDLETSSENLESLFVKAYRKYFKRNNKLFDLAFSIRKKGYKIAILSDQWWVSEEALMLSKDTRKFNASIVSCEVGFRKPNPKIYKIALQKLKVKPTEAIFVDNQEWNITPAKKLGFKTILFKNNKQTIKELKKLGVRI